MYFSKTMDDMALLIKTLFTRECKKVQKNGPARVRTEDLLRVKQT
jgi:hypothetical protein